MHNSPEISVVVAIVDGGETLRSCLTALMDQTGDRRIEVIVPVDHITQSEASLAEDFPDVIFPDYGAPFDGMIPTNPLEHHRFFDKRRAIGLEHATAPLIGIVEDCGFPAPDWADQMIKLHAENEEGVIGGAVVQGIDRVLNWANYFCDFSRYHPPLHVKNPEYVTATNIVYKRDAIMAVRDMWMGGQYQEVKINWELRERGVGTMVSDRAQTISHRHIAGLFTLGNEMFNWARIYGQQRATGISKGTKLKLMVGMPLLPLVLGTRRFRRQLGKGANVGKFIKSAPILLFLLACHGYGEFRGLAETSADPTNGS